VKIAKVLVPVSFNNGILDYIIPEELHLEIFDMVEVPFRNQVLTGYIQDFNYAEVDTSKLKTIIGTIGNFKISSNFDKFLKLSADYYIAPKGEMLKLAIGNIKSKTLNYKPIDTQTFHFQNIKLSAKQHEVKEQIVINIQNNIPTLLQGVTGSGKTEVYSSAAYNILKEPDAQVLIMLPEICLTTQIIDRIKNIFGCDPVVWHSQVSDKKRQIAIHSIISGSAKLIVGARSALYLPYKNLSLIIIDEEHDQSYKQSDGGVTYNARDMAVLRTHIEKSGIILASATPSIETVYNVAHGKYQKVVLLERFHNVSMPEINIIDMKLNKNKCFISDRLREEILATLRKGKQVMLFLNRRGYAPLVLCRECGFRFSCPDCSSWMVKHRKNNKLKCHHCDYEQNIPVECPSCHSVDSFADCGTGVERIYEEVSNFTSGKILVISKDTADSGKEYEKLIDEIKENQIDIIIGTQMISKGLHFPNLELVGIIDADMSAAGMDIRANERAYQLINQVAGRAGREEGIGRVFIQTYYPDSKIIEAIKNQNLEQFILEELEERKHFHLPPYTSQIGIVVSDTNLDRLKSLLKQITISIPHNSDFEVLGPSEAPMFKVRNKFRYRYLVKVQKNLMKTNYIIAKWLDPFNKGQTRIKIDVDPYSFS